jgi:hypothetical protein
MTPTAPGSSPFSFSFFFKKKETKACEAPRAAWSRVSCYSSKPGPSGPGKGHPGVGREEGKGKKRDKKEKQKKNKKQKNKKKTKKKVKTKKAPNLNCPSVHTRFSFNCSDLISINPPNASAQSKLQNKDSQKKRTFFCIVEGAWFSNLQSTL